MGLRAFHTRAFAVAAFALNAFAGDPTPPTPGGAVLRAFQPRAFSRLQAYQVNAFAGNQREPQTLFIESASATLEATDVVLVASNGPPLIVPSPGVSLSGSPIVLKRANWPTVDTILVFRPALPPRSPAQRVTMDAVIFRPADE